MSDDPIPNHALYELASGITVALTIDADGVAYFALPPAAQAQLDRIEAMLAPKKDAPEPPNLKPTVNYLRASGYDPIAALHHKDGSITITTLREVDAENQAWIRTGFQMPVRFEVKPPSTSVSPTQE